MEYKNPNVFRLCLCVFGQYVVPPCVQTISELVLFVYAYSKIFNMHLCPPNPILVFSDVQLIIVVHGQLCWLLCSQWSPQPLVVTWTCSLALLHMPGITPLLESSRLLNTGLLLVISQEEHFQGWGGISEHFTDVVSRWKGYRHNSLCSWSWLQQKKTGPNYYGNEFR